jgi:hypothetical protein
MGTSPATATTSAIPFSTAPSTPIGGASTSLVLAFVLLAAAFVVLWLVRRRGFGVKALVAPGIQGEWSVVQRLRLTATSQAVVLSDGHEKLIVVESRHGVQVTPLPCMDARE